MAKFGTVEVYEELASLLNEDPEWAKQGADMTQTIVFAYGDPVDKNFFIRFESGQITDVKEIAAASQSDADFVIHGAPDTWRRILDGSLRPIKAVTGGDLKVEGSVVSLLKQMKSFNIVLDSLTKIELT